jgi:hypothetical protein
MEYYGSFNLLKVQERKHIGMLNVVDRPMAIHFCLLIYKQLPVWRVQTDTTAAVAHSSKIYEEG